MSLERVQKILARAGIAARRKAEEIITAGRVTINGRVAVLGEKADLETDAVKVDGKRVVPTRRHRYILLNKPKGVMTTVLDPDGRPTVVSLVPPELRKALVPVGRLDFMTEGLLILTDDGEFAQRLSHPRYGCKKTYAVKVTGAPPESEVDKLREGIVLEGRRTSPARIARRRAPAGGREGEAGHTWWTVELFEGRTRQIREMFFRIGHPVQKLRRVAIGRLEDPQLPLGSWRELAAEEVAMLLAGSRAGGARPGAVRELIEPANARPAETNADGAPRAARTGRPTRTLPAPRRVAGGATGRTRSEGGGAGGKAAGRPRPGARAAGFAPESSGINRPFSKPSYHPGGGPGGKAAGRPRPATREAGFASEPFSKRPSSARSVPVKFWAERGPAGRAPSAPGRGGRRPLAAPPAARPASPRGQRPAARYPPTSGAGYQRSAGAPISSSPGAGPPAGLGGRRGPAAPHGGRPPVGRGSRGPAGRPPGRSGDRRPSGPRRPPGGRSGR